MQTYEDRVHAALSDWTASVSLTLHSRVMFTSLTDALSAYTASPEALSDRGERVTLSVWTSVLLTCVNEECDFHMEPPLIRGLLDNDRWHALFDSADTAYAFVFLIARVIDDPRGEWDKAYREGVLSKWRESMVGWLGPAGEVDEHPLRRIAGALFGDAWVTLVYDARGADESLATLIAAARPEFLPGRLTSRLVSTTYILPDMAP